MTSRIFRYVGIGLACCAVIGLSTGCNTVRMECRDAAGSPEFKDLPVEPGETIAAVIRVKWEGYGKDVSNVNRVFLDGVEIRHGILARDVGGFHAHGPWEARPPAKLGEPVFRSDDAAWIDHWQRSGRSGGGEIVLQVYRSDGIDWTLHTHRIRILSGFGTLQGEVTVPFSVSMPEFEVASVPRKGIDLDPWSCFPCACVDWGVGRCLGMDRGIGF